MFSIMINKQLITRAARGPSQTNQRHGLEQIAFPGGIVAMNDRHPGRERDRGVDEIPKTVE